MGGRAMRLRLYRPLAIAAFVSCFLASAQTLAHNAYITNGGDNSMSVIDTATNTVIATIPVSDRPFSVVVTPDGSKVYVTNNNSGNPRTVSVIDTATNTVIATIHVGAKPFGVAVTPDGSKVYVANNNPGNPGTVSVIDTAT